MNVSIQFTCTIPPDLYSCLEAKAKKDSTTRSKVVAKALKLYLTEELSQLDEIFLQQAENLSDRYKSPQDSQAKDLTV